MSRKRLGMNLQSLPDTIQVIFATAGGLGLRGAFVYVGAYQFRYRCAEPSGEYRSGFESHLITKNEMADVDFDVGLQFRVNGKPRKVWTLLIAYEPNDTYTVWLYEAHAGRTTDSMVLACHREVYNDMLKEVIEQTYDQAIQTHNAGFIPLS